MSSSSKNNNSGAVDQYQNLTRIDKNSGEKQEDIERNANAYHAFLVEKTNSYKPTFLKFLKSQKTTTWNLLASFVCFITFFVVIIDKYGFNDKQVAPKMNIRSGVHGSGEVIVSLILFIVCLIIWTFHLVRYFWNPSVSELESRYEQVIVMERNKH